MTATAFDLNARVSEVTENISYLNSYYESDPITDVRDQEKTQFIMTDMYPKKSIENKSETGESDYEENTQTIKLKIVPVNRESQFESDESDREDDTQFIMTDMYPKKSIENKSETGESDYEENTQTIKLKIVPVNRESQFESDESDREDDIEMTETTSQVFHPDIDFENTFEEDERSVFFHENNTIELNGASQTIILEIEPDESTSRIEVDHEEENLNANDLNKNEVRGRRIVDIVPFITQIQDIDNHSESCRFSDMILVHEIKRGLNSAFEFICSTCGAYKRIYSCSKNEKALGTNHAAVLGIRSIGLGKAHIDEFFAHLNVPTMSDTLYNTINKLQQQDWWLLANKSVDEALLKEIELAILNDEVDSVGKALIAASFDGSWGKRSFGSNMTSLSGCAIIMGMRTRKIIYFGVRNKYCHVCKLAEVYRKQVKHHICNKNYSGPSTGMETDIIVNGFKYCDSRGARFNKFVSDGDSNVYKVLQDVRIYKEPDMFVDKYSCVNHLKKNFRKKWRALQKSTNYPVECRGYITNAKCNDICKGIEMAAKHWRDEDIELAVKIENLENDIMNCADHYFGFHSNCDTYFCDKQEDEVGEHILNLLKDCGLYDEIQNACQHSFSNNAKSLLAQYTTNDNESFNNLVCKLLDGKRINNYLAGTYGASVAQAVVHWNSNYRSGTEFHNFKDRESLVIEKLEMKRKRKCESNLLKKKLNPKKRKIIEPADLSESAYGANRQDSDMSVAEFQRSKQRFIEKLQRRQTQRDSIEEKTRHQRLIPYWFEIRRDLLPSSFFGRVVNSRNKTSYKNILDELMYKRSEFGNCAENRHQRTEQRKALSLFKSIYKEFPVKDCGIFIDSEKYYLGATPFKLYGDNCLLSIKCPLKQFDTSVEEAMKKLSLWKTSRGEMMINNKSDWFIEIQGQLHITNRQKALLMVWLGKDYKVVPIIKDDNFFNVVMKEKLSYFFNEVMLKELVDPRRGRHMPPRQYSTEHDQYL